MLKSSPHYIQQFQNFDWRRLIRLGSILFLKQSHCFCLSFFSSRIIHSFVIFERYEKLRRYGREFAWWVTHRVYGCIKAISADFARFESRIMSETNPIDRVKFGRLAIWTSLCAKNVAESCKNVLRYFCQVRRTPGVCKIQYYWLIALYLFISLVCNASFLIK